MKGYSLMKNVGKLAAGYKTYRAAFGSKPSKKGYIRTRVSIKKRGRYRRRRKSKGSVRLRGDDVHSGLASEWINVTLNKRLKGRAEAHMQYYQTNAGWLQDVAGVQGRTVMWGVGHRSAFTGTYTNTNPNSIQTKFNLFNLDPDRANTGSSVLGSVIAQQNQRIALYNVRINTMLTNFENTAATVVLYLVTPKKDTNRYADNIFDDAPDVEDYGNPLETNAAAGLYGNTTAGRVSANHLYVKPTDFKLFNQMYKVLKVHKIQLAGNATEEVNFHININKVIRSDVMDELSQIDNIRRQTVQCMAVWYGQPVHDNTTVNNVEGSYPTTASTKIAVVQNFKYKLGKLKSMQSSASATIGVNQISKNAALANQKFVDINDLINAVVQG